MYGHDSRIEFLHVVDTTALPFRDNSFELVDCSSVLEYVPHEALPAILRELDRVLVDGGFLFVSGTSNRIWPREIHSRSWFSNYLPRKLDPWIFGAEPPERGVTSWMMFGVLGRDRYEDLNLGTFESDYFEVRRRRGVSGSTLGALRFVHRVLKTVGWSVGLVTPSMCVLVRKRSKGGGSTS